MELPDTRCLVHLDLGALSPFKEHKKQKYNVSEAGEIQWLRSPSIDTYYMDDKEAIADYLRFHTRSVALGLAVYGCTKGVVKRGTGVK
eukprot:3262382-Pleurochrysis_carterae.AAC.1